MSAWQIAASDGNHCAAALLSLFEFWHNNRLQASEQASKINDIQERFGDARDQSESLTQYHTSEQLKESLLGLFAEDKIRDAIRLLSSKGFVRVFKNPNPRYAFDRTLHFCFEPDAVNEWLEGYEPSSPNGNFHSRKIGNADRKNPAPLRKNPVSLIEATKKETGRACADAPPSESVSVASPAATGSLPGLEAEPPTGSGIAAPPLAVGGPQGGTPTSTPSEPPKRPKAEKEPNPDFNEFRDAFASAFKRRTGSPYAFQGGKDGVAVKRVLSVCGGAEGAIRLLDEMEAAPESWTHKSCRAGLCSIAVMSSRLNEIRAELAASSRVPGTKPTAPVTPVPKAKPQFEFNGKVYVEEPPRGAFPAGQIGDQIHEAAVAKWKRWVQFGEA